MNRVQKELVNNIMSTMAVKKAKKVKKPEEKVEKKPKKARVKPEITPIDLTKPQLTENQRRFAELVAHGVDKESAYRSCYNVGENTKQSTIVSNSRKLLNNVEVLKEIDRLKDVISVAQSIDHIPDDKRLELLQGETTEEEVMEGEWNQKIAFKKLNQLLKNCEESMVLLKERPIIFGEVNRLMNEVRLAVTKEEYGELYDLMENIQNLMYKIASFDAKEYNSTINTANSIMKSLNDITGITKNAKQIENEAFEKKLLSLISNMDLANRSKPDYVPLKKQMEDYAFDE